MMEAVILHGILFVTLRNQIVFLKEFPKAETEGIKMRF